MSRIIEESYRGETCPRCATRNVHAPSWTWWGGFIGPWLLNHRVCNQCGHSFNGRTGRANDKAIVLFLAIPASLGVVFAIVAGLVVWLSK